MNFDNQFIKMFKVYMIKDGKEMKTASPCIYYLTFQRLRKFHLECVINRN